MMSVVSKKTLESARVDAIKSRKLRTQGESAMTIGTLGVLHGAGGTGLGALNTSASKGGKKYLKAVKRGDSKPSAVATGVRGSVKRFGKFPSYVRGRAGVGVTGAALVGAGAVARHEGSKRVAAKEAVVDKLKAERYARLRSEGKEFAVLKSFEEMSLVEVSKGFGDWKNISQRQTDAKNARRSKKHAVTGASVGLGLAAASGKTGVDATRYVGRGAKNSYQVRRDLGTGRAASVKGAAANTAKIASHMPNKYKFAGAATTAGAGLMAGGAGLYAQGSAKERYNEKRIAGLRRKRNAKRS